MRTFLADIWIVFWPVIVPFVFIGILIGFLSEPTPSTKEIRLIGQCQGKLLGAMEEDEFPHNCDWIKNV